MQQKTSKLSTILQTTVLFASVLTGVLNAQQVRALGAQTRLVTGGAVGVPTVDGNGNVYFLQGSQLHKVAPDGAQSVVYSDDLIEPAAVAADQAGNIYVGTGSSSGVLKIASNGTQSVILPNVPSPFILTLDPKGDLFMAVTNPNFTIQIVKRAANGSVTYIPVLGLIYPIALAADAVGDLFILDPAQGIFKISSNGAQSTVKANLDSPKGMTADASGNLYILDEYLGLVEVSSAGTQTTLPGLNVPTDAGSISTNSNGDLYITNPNSGLFDVQLDSINLRSANVCPSQQNSPTPPCSQTASVSFLINATTMLGAPKVISSGVGAADFAVAGGTCNGALTAESTCNLSVVFAPTVPGLRTGALQLTDTAGNVLTTTYLRGFGAAPLFAFGQSPQSTVGSGFLRPQNVALDASGNAFVVDSDNQRIVKIPTTGAASVIGTWSEPVAVAADILGNAYVADQSSHSVYRVSGNLQVSTVPVSGLQSPSALAVDGRGNLLIADQGSNMILQISPAGAQTTVAFQGLVQPIAVAVDGYGNIFAADSSDNIYKLTPAGVQTSITGFNQPTGIAVDPAGSLYVSDTGSNQILQITSDGTRTALGSGFSGPHGVVLDSLGNIYVADSNNNRVVKMVRFHQVQLTFGSIPVGSASAPQSFSIQNIGNVPLNLEMLSYSAGYKQVTAAGTPQDCSTGLALAPGAQCQVALTVTPGFVGGFLGYVSEGDNNLNMPLYNHSVSVTANGVAAAQTIEFSPIATQSFPSTVTLDANATSGLPVTFTSLTPTVCRVAGAQVQSVFVGTCRIQASQPGNSLYQPAAPVVQSFAVFGLSL